MKLLELQRPKVTRLFETVNSDLISNLKQGTEKILSLLFANMNGELNGNT